MSEASSIIYGIYTCPKYQDRTSAVRDTWFKQIPKDAVALFVVSDEGNEARVEGQTLYLDCPEGYEYLTSRTCHFIRFCIEHFEFEYIFKMDDDTYLNVPRFLNFQKTGDYIGRFVGRPDRDCDRTWHYGKFSNPSLEKPFEGTFITRWAAGGDGYLLNRKAADSFVLHSGDILESELRQPAYCGYEDKMVADVLSKDDSIITQNAPLGSFGTVHPLTPLAMRALHAQFKPQS